MNQPISTQTVLLAAGGTGGHIFPAVALAEVLLARGFRVELVTDHRFHQYTKAMEGALAQLPIHTIRAGNLKGGLVKKLMSGIGISLGVMQALTLIARTRPVAVVGFGGYPSLPTMLAAVIARQRTIIHEQNSVLGRVNRAIAPRVTRIATSYADTRKMPEAAREQVVLTGNPVRAAVCAVANTPYPELTADGVMNLLVIGGSQGASVFSDVLPAAMELLSAELRARIKLTQQCRAGEIAGVQARYAALGMKVELASFFGDVAARLAATHLMICRAGASTVAELMIAGRPGLLVPLPIATDNHQYYNAQAIEDASAGWVVTQDAFTPTALAAKLETLLRAPQRLAECAIAMHRLGLPRAAEKLADLVIDDGTALTPSPEAQLAVETAA